MQIKLSEQSLNVVQVAPIDLREKINRYGNPQFKPLQPYKGRRGEKIDSFEKRL